MRVGLAQKECDHSAWARPCFELWAAYGPRFATFQVIAHAVGELSRRTFSNHRRGEFLRPVLCSCWYLSLYYGRAKRTATKFVLASRQVFLVTVTAVVSWRVSWRDGGQLEKSIPDS